MTEPQSDALPPLLAAWSGALVPVLTLLNEQQRGPFRQELQRFLAASRFAGGDVDEYTERLKGLLLQAARAAAQPAAINLTRDIVEPSELVALCEHLLASWSGATAAAGSGAGCADTAGISGEVFFGPRLGGAGRSGALQRDNEEPVEHSDE